MPTPSRFSRATNRLQSYIDTFPAVFGLVIPLTIFIFAILIVQTDAASIVGKNHFTGLSTSVSTNLGYIALPPADTGKSYRAQYLSGTSDKAASVVTFYSVATPVRITAAANAGQPTVTAVGTTFGNGDKVLVYDVSARTMTRYVVSSSTSTTVTFTDNLATALDPGDMIYEGISNGTIPVGATTKEINTPGSAIYTWPSGAPAWADLDSTSTAPRLIISGDIPAN